MGEGQGIDKTRVDLRKGRDNIGTRAKGRAWCAVPCLAADTKPLNCRWGAGRELTHSVCRGGDRHAQARCPGEPCSFQGGDVAQAPLRWVGRTAQAKANFS